MNILKTLLPAALLLITSTAGAYNFAIGDLYYKIVPGSPQKAEVTYYQPGQGVYSGKIKIPATIVNDSITYTVTAIGEDAFKGCRSLTDITIGANITEIKKGAFSGCKSLTSITVPSGVTIIGDSAFCGCMLLTEISLPKSLEKISDYTFHNCEELTTITIPASVTSIGNSAFAGCKNLTGITIPEKVIKIGDFAFADCRTMKTVNFNAVNCASAGERGRLAFARCNAINSITIGNNVTNIPPSLFMGCNAIKSVTITDNVKTIGSGAFLNCSGLSSVVIGRGVINIGSAAFSGCSNLVNLTYNAEMCIKAANKISPVFGSQTPLTELTIGSDVKVLQSDIFSGCKGISHITLNAERCTGLAVNKKSVFADSPMFVQLTIGSSVKELEPLAFAGCKALNSVTLCATACQLAGSFQEPVFKDCNTLANVTIENGAGIIPSYLFAGCDKISQIKIPASITQILDFAFAGCNGITSFTVDPANKYFAAPDGVLTDKSINTILQYPAAMQATTYDTPAQVTKINPRAFYKSTNLKRVMLNNKVSVIGNAAFKGCTGLEGHFTIPATVTTLGEEAFTDCNQITAFNVNEKNTSYTSVNGAILNKAQTMVIKYPAASQATTFDIPATVHTISNAAFIDSKNIRYITFPESVTTIDDFSFSGCDRLANIILGKNVSYIGMWAFARTPNLDVVACLAVNPPEISDFTFDNYTATLYVPGKSIPAYIKSKYWGNFATPQDILNYKPQK